MEFKKSFAWFLSGEWLLNKNRPNSGDVVLARSIWVGTLIIFLLSLIRGISMHGDTDYISLYAIYCQACSLISSAEGPVIYGVTYAALYARFVSQWTYIANLYNQIKQAEVVGIKNRRSLAQWKAGFIEDALELHLASKPVVKGVIQAWSRDTYVRAAFMNYAPESKSKWAELKNFAELDD